jgi:hypothetical protein
MGMMIDFDQRAEGVVATGIGGQSGVAGPGRGADAEGNVPLSGS